jgi:prolyl oligopeptidase
LFGIARLYIDVLKRTTFFMKVPDTRREDVRDLIHGVEIPDPYRWLEDGNSAETRAWIAAQQEFAAPFLKTSERERIHRRLAELMKIEVVGIPFERRDQYFFLRRNVDQQQGVICHRRGLDGPDEVLIDPNPMSPDHSVSVDILDVTPDGSLLAYAVRHGGEDEHEIRAIDVASRSQLVDVLPRAKYYQNVSWRHDLTGFYYSVWTDKESRILFHRLGTDPSADLQIFREEASTRFLFAGVTDDGRYLVISVFHGAGGSRNDIYLKRLDSDGPVIPIVNDIDATFFANYAGDALILHTNWEAPNWRVIRVDLKNPPRDRWQEIIPENSAGLRYLSAIGGKLFAVYLKNVLSRVSVFEPDGTIVGDLDVTSTGTVYPLAGRWSGAAAFFQYSSFDQPTSIYRYEIASGVLQTWWREKVPASFDQFEVRQVWYSSKDGTRVPMFLFHRRDIELDGARPTLLNGYGGFNASVTPWFWPQALAWVESGGIFAYANLRGGGEFGEEWHRAGRLEKKQNVFDDFVAAAEWLIANRYTNADRLAAMGGSNGGLLVGAALTQRPDLFRAIFCGAPLLDMIRYHKRMLGPMWISEYGCADDPEQFRYLLAYSPYHNVRAGTHYPAVMFMTGDSDTRVDPMHARKMAAMLQWATASKPDERPILLHYRTESGHMAGLAIDAAIDDSADQLAFLFRELGVNLRG